MMKPKEQMLVSMLDSFKAEYAELSAIWRILEYKAQANITICGIFLAAIFAFVRTGPQSPGCLERCLFSITILLLTACVVLSICVLLVKSMPFPPMGVEFAQRAHELFAAEVVNDEVYGRFANDHSGDWEKVNDEVREVIARKCSFLVASQWVLMAAIGVAVITTLYEFWK